MRMIAANFQLSFNEISNVRWFFIVNTKLVCGLDFHSGDHINFGPDFHLLYPQQYDYMHKHKHTWII